MKIRPARLTKYREIAPYVLGSSRRRSRARPLHARRRAAVGEISCRFVVFVDGDLSTEFPLDYGGVRNAAKALDIGPLNRPQPAFPFFDTRTQFLDIGHCVLPDLGVSDNSISPRGAQRARR